MIRVAFIGAGGIAGVHLRALQRLGRSTLVGIVGRTPERVRERTSQWGGAPYPDVVGMLDTAKPDVVYVCGPPFKAVDACEALVDRGIPFFVEKPLSATDAAGPARIASAIARTGLVTAVGYNMRGLDMLPEIRRRLAEHPPHLILGRWLDSTPRAAWWGRLDEGGGQVVEQATHLYDFARHLCGEADVLAAASTRDPVASPRTIDVADATAALLRFDGGAIGSFSNSRRLASSAIELGFVSDGLSTSIRLQRSGDTRGWIARFEDGETIEELPNRRDSYEAQAEAFLDAVEAGDPTLVLSSYADALRTDRLTRAVVAATGARG